MAANRAKHIILASRSGKKQASMIRVMEELTKLGTNVQVYASDMSNKTDVQNLVEDCAKNMPPIGGVIHGAYVNKVCSLYQRG